MNSGHVKLNLRHECVTLYIEVELAWLASNVRGFRFDRDEVRLIGYIILFPVEVVLRLATKYHFRLFLRNMVHENVLSIYMVP